MANPTGINQYTRGGGLAKASKQASQRARNRQNAGSFVIKNKQTGAVVTELMGFKGSDRATGMAVLSKLNTAKYRAQPIKEHLSGMNRSIKQKTYRRAK